MAGGRLRALLARLAVDPDRRVSTAELVAAVWPDDAPAEPVNSLQSLVSRLRRVLSDPALVVQETTGYRLRLRPADLDAAVFTEQVRRGHEALLSGNADVAYAQLCGALDLWRGEPLTDVGDGDYRESYAGRWAEDRLQAIKDQATLRLRRGEAAGLSGELEALVGAHPFDESLMVLLLQSLAAAGRMSEALARYERLRRFLADELGTDPGRELQDLHLQLLRGDGPPPAATLLPRTRSNLRTWLTSFVGREADVDRVLESVRANRLTTVVGPGGTGKTRLATEAAARWLTDTNSAWLVELAPVTEAANIPAAILGALGMRDARVAERSERGERPAPEAMDRLLDALRPSEYLLVIDNCEHLIEAAAEIIDTILAQAPGVRVLTTSREPLGLIGEAICALPPLAQPPTTATSAEAADFPAVQLWLDRARVVRPDFVLDAETVAPVIEIVRRLDGLPLAIELAAARLRVLPAAEIAHRLSDRFRLLTGGNRAGLPRHRTLRAVVEWSWDLLTAEERLLAERLAVFPAGADSASATRICADARLPAADIDSLLISLVDKSLLQSIESTGPHDSFRFRMLETIREYGIERLAERNELEDARIAHSRYFADLVISLEPVLRSADQLSAMRTLEVERENILAALRFLGDSGRPVEALQMALALVWYWSLIGSSSEALTWLGFVIAVNEADPPPELLFARAGFALSRMSRDEAEEADAEPTETLNWSEEIDSFTELSTQLLETPTAPFPGLEAIRPMVAHFADRTDLADRMVEQGLASADRWVRAALLATTAFTADNDSDVVRMRETAGAAYTDFTEIGDRWGIASCLLVLARLSTIDGRLDDAEYQYEQAWKCLSELGGSDEDEIYVRIRTADLYARRGEWDEARRTLAPSRPDRPSTDRDLFGEACLASIEWMAGDLDQALTRVQGLRERLQERERVSVQGHHMAAVVLGIAGGLEAVAGDLTQAAEDLASAYVGGTASRDMPILCVVGVSVAAYALALGRPEASAMILGATAQVRGADDPGDPLVATLTRQLRDSGVDFDAAYARGRDLDRPSAIAALDPATLPVPPAGVGQARRR